MSRRGPARFAALLAGCLSLIAVIAVAQPSVSTSSSGAASPGADRGAAAGASSASAIAAGSGAAQVAFDSAVGSALGASLTAFVAETAKLAAASSGLDVRVATLAAAAALKPRAPHAPSAEALVHLVLRDVMLAAQADVALLEESIRKGNEAREAIRHVRASKSAALTKLADELAEEDACIAEAQVELGTKLQEIMSALAKAESERAAIFVRISKSLSAIVSNIRG